MYKTELYPHMTDKYRKVERDNLVNRKCITKYTLKVITERRTVYMI